MSKTETFFTVREDMGDGKIGPEYAIRLQNVGLAPIDLKNQRIAGTQHQGYF